MNQDTRTFIVVGLVITAVITWALICAQAEKGGWFFFLAGILGGSIWALVNIDKLFPKNSKDKDLNRRTR